MVPRRRVAILFSLLAVWAFSAAVHAQTFRGSISGRVADATGAVLPGVSITATNDATGVSRATVTSANGDFSVPDLQLGTYTIEASLQGFQTVRTKVEVSVSQIASVELKMGLSQVAETINVTASAVMLDTVSTALSNVVRPKQVQDLPLNGRDFTQDAAAGAGCGGDQHVGERRAHPRQQLPDRRRRQQRRVPERGGGEPGRRLRHRRHAAADRSDRSVLRAVAAAGAKPAATRARR